MKILFCLLFFISMIFLPAEETIDFPFKNRLFFSSDFEGNHELYMLSQNKLKRLTRHSAWDEWPVANRKGDTLVFTSDRSGNFDIFLLDLESLQVKKVTHDPREERDPSWSYDDRFVYYIVKDGGDWIPMKTELATGKVSKIFPQCPYSSIVALFQNHTGDQFFFTAKTFLGWTVASYSVKDAKFERRAKRGSCRPKISWNDRRVAYVSAQDDGLGDVWIMNRDGNGQRNLTKSRNSHYDYYPCFSPDGRWIAFSSSPKEEGKSGYDLYMLELSTGKIKPLFLSKGNDAYPFWTD